MKNINSFIIIGGDKRQLYMADYFESLGYKTDIYGLPETKQKCIDNIRLNIRNYDCVVMPLPFTKDGKNIFSIVPIKENTDEILSYINSDQPVFAGMVGKNFRKKAENKKIRIHDYFSREDVTVMNTVPTVQGIIKVICENIDYTIHSSRCAVFGFGRVAKLTAETLLALGADVTVCARKSGDIALAKTKGFKGVYISDFKDSAKNYDIIINTVPALVINKEILEKLKNDCLIIDVASSPFGTDFSAAFELGLKALQCSSLPGKVAPKTAGKIIADGILNIIKEEYYE